MPTAVILEHDVPGQGTHLDWMIEDPTLPADRPLRTWRTDTRPDESDTFAATQIADHRARYLRFEGDIGQNRGSVRRLASGTVIHCSVTPDHAEIEIAWASGAHTHHRGHPQKPPSDWRFTRISGQDSTS